MPKNGKDSVQELSNILDFFKLNELSKNISKNRDYTHGVEDIFVDNIVSALSPDYDVKRNNRINRYIRMAKYAIPNACVENLDFRQERGLNSDFILRLADGDYINRHSNVIILGPSGSGKTYLGNALGVSANRNLVKVRYWRQPDLLEAAAQTRIEGTHDVFLKILQNVPVLILDEWLISEMTGDDLMIMLNVFEKRYDKFSTILCTHFAIGDWVDRLGSTPMAESIVDRLINRAYTIRMGGKKSMRTLDALEAKKEKPSN
jgi:DNA replication protein DnaC